MEEIKEDDITKAIKQLDQSKTPGKKATKKEPEVKVPNINTYKTNEIAVTINKFLSSNIDQKAGECLLGENLARTGEFYGLKAHPIIALVVSVIGVIVIAFKKVMSLEKKQKDDQRGF